MFRVAREWVSKIGSCVRVSAIEEIDLEYHSYIRRLGDGVETS